MPPNAPRQSSLYVYAIADPRQAGLEGVQGVTDAPTQVVRSGDLAAVVSPLAARRLRPDRAAIAAHQRVLRALMTQGTVLPASFGLIAGGPESLIDAIDEHEQDLCAQLERVAGRVEMGLRVRWQVDDIVAHMVKASPELRRARDHLARGRASHDDRVNAGRLFERTIEERRREHAQALVSALEPAADEVAHARLKGEADVTNLACLVERGRLDEFERAVHDAASGFDETFVFDLSGPWAPHNFVTMRLSLAGEAPQEAAC